MPSAAPLPARSVVEAEPLPPTLPLPVIERALATAIGFLDAGRPAEAIAALSGVAPSRHVGPAHGLLVGRVLSAAHAHEQALAWFAEAEAAGGSSADLLVQRGHTLARLGRASEAMAAYEAAVQAGTRDPAAFAQYGHLLAAVDRLADAALAYDLALQLQPAAPDVLRAAADLLQRTGQVDGALDLLDQALACDPGNADAILDRANLLHGADRFDEALATYDAALTTNPGHALFWNNRAIVLHDLGQMEPALASLTQALALDSASAQAHMNSGTILFRLCRYDEALAAFDQALTLRPAYPEARCGRGLVLKLLGRFAEALAEFNNALAIDPDSIYARANRGELRLLLGKFAAGWPDYEFRFFTERQKKPALPVPVPEWAGVHRPGDRIAVFADQGNGDTIQFARFLPHLAAQGARVSFICPPRLQHLLADVTRDVEVLDAVGESDGFDYQIALSSMPGAFKTDLGTLAASAPYLSANPARVGYWASRLGSEGLRIGLCWRGSPNWQCDPNRSIPLAAFAPLAAMPGVRLVSLQMPDNAEAGASTVPLLAFNDDLDTGPDAFVDTAALMQSLDLVITCDTSIAHLAGALGRPVWVLLQVVPEWRWMLDRPDSPWYPTVRLFRQTQRGDWTAPIADAMRAIRDGDLMPVWRQGPATR